MNSIEWFVQISKIPRPSGHEEKVASFLVEIAKSRGYNYRTDDVGNVCIIVPAKGKGTGKPVLVLQAHMDMVCEKDSNVDHDFLNDPITVYEEQGFLKAKGTTLGADNGIGIALALYAMDLDENPPLELLFTVDEETSFAGVKQMKKGFFTGDYLINLDSGKDDYITIGSAGSMQVEYFVPIERDSQYSCQFITELTIDGLRGGHSGTDIHTGRVSATWFSIQCLGYLTKNDCDFRLISLHSDQAPNAIARFAQLHIAFVSDDEYRRAKTFLKEFSFEGFSERPILTFKDILAFDTGIPWDKKSCDLFISLSLQLPHGVLSFLKDQNKIVQTSCNFAKIKEVDLQHYYFSLYCRSFEDSDLKSMAKNMKSLGYQYGVQCVVEDPGPVWWSPYDKNILLKIAKKCYSDLFGYDVNFGPIHAGLECAYLEKIKPCLCVISMGPNIDNPHSPRETLDIASTKRVEMFLCRIIQEFVVFPWGDVQ